MTDVPARIIDGKAVSQRLRTDLAAEVAGFKTATGVTPHLAAVLVGDDPASAVYVRSKSKGCEQAGMAGSLHALPASTSQAQLLDLVRMQIRRNDTTCLADALGQQRRLLSTSSASVQHTLPWLHGQRFCHQLRAQLLQNERALPVLRVAARITAADVAMSTGHAVDGLGLAGEPLGGATTDAQA